MTVPVRIEGLLFFDTAEAQRSLALSAHTHLRDAGYAGSVRRREGGDWIVEVAGENDHRLALLPVTRDCADVDEVFWQVWVSGDDATDVLLTDHLGLDPELVIDLVEDALDVPKVAQRFTPVRR